MLSNILLTVSVSFALLLGVKTRYAGICYVLLTFIGNSFKFSFGKIDHPIMFPVFILGLSFSNWGTYYALIPDKKISIKMQRRILAILAVLLCFGMFTAGFEKALYWIDFNLEKGGFLHWFYSGYFNLERQYLLAPFVLKVPPKIFEIFDYLLYLSFLQLLLFLLVASGGVAIMVFYSLSISFR